MIWLRMVSFNGKGIFNLLRFRNVIFIEVIDFVSTALATYKSFSGVIVVVSVGVVVNSASPLCLVCLSSTKDLL